MAKRRPKLLIDEVPEVAEYFDYSATQEDLYSIKAYSREYIPLLCPYCGNKYEKAPGSITIGGVYCRKCRSVEIQAPHLLKEWDYRANKDKDPGDTLAGSGRKVWWVCFKCGYRWRSSPHNRVRKGHGCHACTGKVAYGDNRLSEAFPDIAKQWHPTKNGGRTPYNTTVSSGFRAWWVCEEGHEWEGYVYNRKKGIGCPVCAGQVATPEKSIVKTYPAVAKEFHPTKNTIGAGTLLPMSNKKIWWVCGVCGHEWEAFVFNRTKGHGCPACSHQVVIEENSLAYKRPDIAKEWNYDRNETTPEEHNCKTNKKVWWKCEVCSNEWETYIAERCRTDRAAGRCPECHNHNISHISQGWLDSMGVPEEYREYRFRGFGGPKGYLVDAYDPEKNTVYEFLGDFWHGNPKIYNKKEVNPTVKKSYGYLYKQTMERLRSIEEAGYNIVYVWESDYLEEEKQRGKKEV